MDHLLDLYLGNQKQEEMKLNNYFFLYLFFYFSLAFLMCEFFAPVPPQEKLFPPLLLEKNPIEM